MKQTTVEWLEEKFNSYDLNVGKEEFRKLLNQAKQMEKEQIIAADLAGVKRTVLNVHTNLVKIPHVLQKIEEIETGELNHENGEQYYADTFKR